MTTPGDDHERRIASVEQEVRAQRQETARAVAEAGAARVLAAGADKDNADIRATLNAQVGLLNALHETQQEHTRRFDQVDERFGQIDDRFGQIDEQFAQVDRNFVSVQAQFVTVHAGIAQIVRLLTPGDATA